MVPKLLAVYLRKVDKSGGANLFVYKKIFLIKVKILQSAHKSGGVTAP